MALEVFLAWRNSRREFGSVAAKGREANKPPDGRRSPVFQLSLTASVAVDSVPEYLSFVLPDH